MYLRFVSALNVTLAPDSALNLPPDVFQTVAAPLSEVNSVLPPGWNELLPVMIGLLSLSVISNGAEGVATPQPLIAYSVN